MYDVTPRMLRHYEKLGLIVPTHKEGYAYRLYDECAVRRLQQIIILRKLRIPLKQIAVILKDDGQLEALRIMRDNIAELDEEIASLGKVRSVLNAFVQRLDESIQRNARLDLLEDSALVEVVDMLTLSKSNLKEKYSMSELDKANEKLEKSDNVRILRLPPFTVASYQYIGENPEDNADEIIEKFIRESKLYEIKPDSRWFGFNHPNPGILENGVYGYEIWVTIPDDMEVSAPLTKKKFDGGMYAVRTMRFPEFHIWGELANWAENSKEYEPNYSEQGLEIMGGCLEEHLNWVYAAHTGRKEDGALDQLDLMLPIKRRKK